MKDHSPLLRSGATASSLPFPAALSHQWTVTSEGNSSNIAPPLSNPTTPKRSSTSRRKESKVELPVPQGRKKQRISATDLPQIPTFQPFEVPFQYHQAKVSVNTMVVEVEKGRVGTWINGPSAKIWRLPSLVQADQIFSSLFAKQVLGLRLTSTSISLAIKEILDYLAHGLFIRVLMARKKLIVI